MDDRLVPVPQEAYDALELDVLRNNMVRLNLAVFALKDTDPHPEYERTKAFYEAEQRKCNRALVAKVRAERAANGEPDPPDITIGMKPIELQSRVLK